MIYRDQAFIPPLDEALLEGVTLRTIIKFLKEAGIEVVCESIDRSMIYCAQELMMVGTAFQVAWVASVDGRPLGKVEEVINKKEAEPGPICRLLREKFAETIAGTHPRAKEVSAHKVREFENISTKRN